MLKLIGAGLFSSLFVSSVLSATPSRPVCNLGRLGQTYVTSSGTIEYCLGSVWVPLPIQSVPGPQGPMGPIGPQGLKGDQGIQGEIGSQGPIGLPGVAGPIGPQGLKGDQGIQGEIGSQGPIGLPGVAGPIGPQGLKGDQGIQGEVGPQGPIGLPGVAGAAGAQGLKGDKGDQGDVGPQGPTGLPGVAGATGPQGLPGVAGPSGPQGATGLQGLPGIVDYSYVDAQKGKIPVVASLPSCNSSMQGNLVFLVSYSNSLMLCNGVSWVTTQRQVYRSSGAFEDNTDNGVLANRSLSFFKNQSSTAIHISYTDSFRLSNPNSFCRWEVKVDGASCPSGPVMYGLYTSIFGDMHQTGTTAAYCTGIGPGSHVLSVFVSGGGDCYTGLMNRWSLSAEELQ